MITNWGINFLVSEKEKLEGNYLDFYNDRITCILNYKELIDILLDRNIVQSQYISTNGTKINDIKKYNENILDLLFIKKLYDSKKFKKSITSIKKCYDSYEDDEEEMLPYKISVKELINLGYEYYDEYKNKEKLMHYNKLVKSNNFYFKYKKFKNLIPFGMTFNNDFNKQIYLIVSKEDTILDISTFIHEMEHAIVYNKYKTNSSSNYSELPAYASTYYLSSFLKKNGFDGDEVDKAIRYEISCFVSHFSNIYYQYELLNDINYSLLCKEYKLAVLNKVSISDYYNLYNNVNLIYDNISSAMAKYIFDNFSLDESEIEIKKYLEYKKKYNPGDLNMALDSGVEELNKHKTLTKKI